MEWLVWLVLLVVILGFEARALLQRKRGDTLSEAVWWLRARLWGRMLLFPLFMWLGWHFFLEPGGIGPYAPGGAVWFDDIIVVMAGVILALFRDYEELDVRQAERDRLDSTD